jgi:hypothetical protein
MANPLAMRNFDFNESYSGNNSFEFSQFFTKKKLPGGKVGYRVKKEALKQTDILYFSLPKCGKAIDIISKTSVNKGIEILKGTGDKEQASEADLKMVEDFSKTLLPSPIEFLEDVVRMKRTKGNLLLVLSETKKGSKAYLWAIIEPERFSVVSNSENEVLSKYDIDSYLLHKKEGVQDLDKNYTLFVRSSPASILGVPPLLFNHLYSKTIVADVKKNFQIQENGAFKKSLANAKKIEIKNGQVQYRSITNKELAKISADILMCQSDPNKSIQITDVEVNLTELPTIEADPAFTERYDKSYVLHTASVTGVAPYRLLPPESINRATAQQQYSEMIEDTIQPLNNSLSILIQKMFDIWFSTTTKNDSKIKLTIQNPKPMLDIDVTAKDLGDMEKNKQIKTNELRDRISLEPYNEDDQKAREDYRTAQTKQPNLTII